MYAKFYQISRHETRIDVEFQNNPAVRCLYRKWHPSLSPERLESIKTKCTPEDEQQTSMVVLHQLCSRIAINRIRTLFKRLDSSGEKIAAFQSVFSMRKELGLLNRASLKNAPF